MPPSLRSRWANAAHLPAMSAAWNEKGLVLAFVSSRIPVADVRGFLWKGRIVEKECLLERFLRRPGLVA